MPSNIQNGPIWNRLKRTRVNSLDRIKRPVYIVYIDKNMDPCKQSTSANDIVGNIFYLKNSKHEIGRHH